MLGDIGRRDLPWSSKPLKAMVDADFFEAVQKIQRDLQRDMKSVRRKIYGAIAVFYE